MNKMSELDIEINLKTLYQLWYELLNKIIVIGQIKIKATTFVMWKKFKYSITKQ